jgi:hypothetical protein
MLFRVPSDLQNNPVSLPDWREEVDWSYLRLQTKQQEIESVRKVATITTMMEVRVGMGGGGRGGERERKVAAYGTTTKICSHSLSASSLESAPRNHSWLSPWHSEKTEISKLKQLCFLRDFKRGLCIGITLWKLAAGSLHSQTRHYTTIISFTPRRSSTRYSGHRITLSFTTESGEGKMKRRKDWVISPHVLSLRGLPLPPPCVFVMVIQAQGYVASTVPAVSNWSQSRYSSVWRRRFSKSRSFLNI